MYDRKRFHVFRCLVILLCLGTIVLAGCRTGRIEGSRSITLTVERNPNERGYYRDIEVFEDERGLHVTGYVKRFIEPGHVHVMLMDAGGHIIAEKRVDVHGPLRSSRVRSARFEVLFPAFERDPEAVQIVHHKSSDEDCAGS